MCKYILAGLLLLIPLSAISAEAEWPPGSAMSVGLESNERKAQTLSQINKLHDETMILVNESLGAHISRPLIEFNQVWVQYATTACLAARETFEGASPWKSARTSQCQLNLAERRLFVLGRANACVKRHIRNQRENEIPQCFYQTLSIEF